jgi:hypothetical protein
MIMNTLFADTIYIIILFVDDYIYTYIACSSHMDVTNFDVDCLVPLYSGDLALD